MADFKGKEEEVGVPVDSEDRSEQQTDLENQSDSIQQDGASQPLHIDPQLEKRVVRKIDLHIMPLVIALCRCS